MRRDPKVFIWDAWDSAEAMLSFVEGKTREGYEQDRMLRAAVERSFEIIGEALRLLREADPQLASEIPDLNRAVGFRNTLAHGYFGIDNDEVWRTIHEDLPGLRDALGRMLEETD